MLPVTITIDGKKVKVKSGETILDAARQADIYIPTLCFHPDLSTRGICEICLVEIKGNKKLQKACQYVVRESIDVLTDTSEIRQAREAIVKHKLKSCPQCSDCLQVSSCELKKLAERLGIDVNQYQNEKQEKKEEKIDISPAIIRDMNLCIQCGRCVSACGDLQNIEIYQYTQDGVSTHKGLGLEDVRCTYCGQCVLHCPTGALREKEDIVRVKEVLNNPEKVVIVQLAPAAKIAIGEAFGYPPGTCLVGQLITALRKLGFDYVFDTQLGVDIVCIEYCGEFIERKKKKEMLPLIDSSCPASVKFIEDFYPELIPYLSSVKSPQAVFGTAAKTYYAEQMGINPQQMVVVSVMPCTAKKFECLREGMKTNGLPDVDFVLTIREVVKMLQEKQINLSNLPEEDYNDFLGVSSGAGAIYPVSGGVAECYLRTLEIIYQGDEQAKKRESLEFRSIRGTECIKEAIYKMGEQTIRVLAVSGLANVRKACEWLKNKEVYYDIIEFMSCPGGCIGGGGQIRPLDYEVRRKRIEAKYNEDELKEIRRSHENPSVNEFYDKYIGVPNGNKAKEILHLSYGEERKRRKEAAALVPSRKDWRRGSRKEMRKSKEKSIGSKLEKELEKRAQDNAEPCIRCGNCLADCLLQLFDDREMDFGEQADYLNALVFSEKDEVKKVPPKLKKALMECTLCGKCNQYCPEDLDRLGVHLYARTKIGPSLTARTISPLTFSDIQNAIAKTTTHFDWSKKEKEWYNSLIDYHPAHTLLYYGCHCHMKEMPRLAIELEKILLMTGRDFTRLGTYKYCCGGLPLYWAMLQDAKRQAAILEKVFSQVQPKQIITMCGHCYDSIKRIVRLTNLQIKVKHVVEFLAEIVEDKRFSLQPLAEKVSYHDACLVERADNLYHFPRQVLSALGTSLSELPNNKRMASCCGWTIGKWLAYNRRKMLELHERIALDLKMTGADKLVVSCALCYEIFSRNKNFPPTVHLVDLVAQSLGQEMEKKE